MPGKTDWKHLGGLLLPLVLVLIFWNTFLVYPLQILVVFFHEISHAIAAMATGGSVVKIQVAREVGGSCETTGGEPFLILTAGYLGSLVWGGAILILGARTRQDKLVLGLLGGLLILVSIIFIRPILDFGFGFGLFTGWALVAVSVYLSSEVNDYLLRVIGLTSCLYAILDIKNDILDRPDAPSDAYMLAQLTGFSTWFWGILWISIAIVAAIFFLWIASRKPPVDQVSSST